MPMPDHPEQGGGDQRRVEDDGCPDDVAVGARGLESFRQMAADQRQDDHPVQRHQEAARCGIVDRRDAALRRGGPEPGAEQKIERAPVEERMEDFLAQPAADALGIANPGKDEAGRDDERQQRHHVEQYGAPEGAQRRMADEAVEAFQSRPVQQEPHDVFRRQAGRHDSQQQEGRPAVHDVGQGGQMLAEGRNLLQREFKPVGQEREERSRGAFGAEGGPGRGRASPRRGEPAQRRCRCEP